jgi:hypothetical protein
MILLAAGASLFGIFAALIPIVGLVLIGWILWKAIRPPEDQPPDKS